MTEKLKELRIEYSGAYNLVEAINFIAVIVYIIAAGVLAMGLILATEAHGSASGFMFAGTFFVTLILGLVALVMQGIASGLKAVADIAVHTARVLTK